MLRARAKRHLKWLAILGICATLIASGQTSGGLAAEPRFSDVDPNSTSPYAVAIYELARRGIVFGYSDGRFGPQDPVLRVQAAAIVVRALGWSGVQGRSDFSDRGGLTPELWNSVRVLADRNVARGYGDGTFHPLDNVSQAQVISLITRAMVYEGRWQQQANNPALYPDVPASSGHRGDIVTYDRYAGQIALASGKGAGGWRTWSRTANRQEVALIVWNALKASAPTTGARGACGEDMMHWHPPLINGCAAGHDHGDAPPAWVNASRWMPMYEHPGNTPQENVLKHTSFKGFTLRLDGVDIYLIMHLDSTPNGHTSRFHSYQVWARDGAGGVSHWDLWADFGSGNETGPHLQAPDNCGNDGTRPIMMVNYQSCPRIGTSVPFENWYSRAAAPLWGWDLGFNLQPQYFAGPTKGVSSNGDLANAANWIPTGQLNANRRVEMAWYANRSNQRGDFWSTQWGEVVSGPNDSRCGQQRAFGAKSYTTLCIAQYVAPTMTTIQFTGNAFQKTYDLPGVKLPN